MLTTVAVMTGALGLQMPAYLANAIFRLRGWWRQDRAGAIPPKDPSEEPAAPPCPSDTAIFHLSLASTGVVAGLACLLTVAMMAAFRNVHDLLTRHFFWTVLTSVAMEWAAFTGLTGLLWLMDGLAVSALAVVRDVRAPDGRPAPTVGTLLMGFATAWAVHEWWLIHILSGAEHLMLAAVAMLVVAALAAFSSPHAGPQQVAPTSRTPELAGEAIRWLWVCLFAWGLGAALCFSGWLACREEALQNLVVPTRAASGLVWLLSAATLLARQLPPRTEPASMAGYGMVLWVTGLAGSLVVVLAALQPANPTALRTEALILAAGFGYALSRIERLWLASASGSASALAQMASALCPALALGLILAHNWAAPLVGPIGLIATGSLLLITLGGLVQIHAHGPELFRRRRYLACTFGTLALAIVVFPASTRAWSRWIHAHTPRSPRVTISLKPFVSRNHPAVCLINVPPNIRIVELDGNDDRITYLAFGADTSPGNKLQKEAAGARYVSHDAFREMRLQRRSYEVIYQRGSRPIPSYRFALYSKEWLAQLADHLTPGGRLILDVPLAGMSLDAIRVIGATLADATQGPCYWVLVEADPEPFCRLVGLPTPADAPPPPPFQPLNLLCPSSNRQAPIHSVQKDRITPTLNPQGDASSVYRRLREIGMAPGQSHKQEGRDPRSS